MKRKRIGWSSVLVCLVALGSVNAQHRRNKKKLTHTFQLNQRSHADEVEHVDDRNKVVAIVTLPDRDAGQGDGNDEFDLNIGSIATSGERYIHKVLMVQETEYDDGIECIHSNSERCHTNYTTDCQQQQEEECDENFVKKYFIEYKKVAVNETIKLFQTDLVCKCDGPEECKRVCESLCETRYREHRVEDDVAQSETIQYEKCDDVTQGYITEKKCTKWPRLVFTTEKKQTKKFSPETECRKVPREPCGPYGCIPTPGPEECFDKKDIVVQEVPEENCNLEPQRSCKHVTKLSPLLKPQEECVDIP